SRRSLCLSRGTSDGPTRKGEQLIQVACDDALDDGEVDLLVGADRHVTEADHALHLPGQIVVEVPGAAQQVERVATLLWDPEALDPDHVHSDVDRTFRGALKVQQDGVLPGQVGAKIGGIARVDLAYPLDAALD